MRARMRRKKRKVSCLQGLDGNVEVLGRRSALSVQQVEHKEILLVFPGRTGVEVAQLVHVHCVLSAVHPHRHLYPVSALAPQHTHTHTHTSSPALHAHQCCQSVGNLYIPVSLMEMDLDRKLFTPTKLVGGRAMKRSEERRVGKERRSRWS